MGTGLSLTVADRPQLAHVEAAIPMAAQAAVAAMQEAGNTVGGGLTAKGVELAVASTLALTTKADILANLKQLPMVSIRTLYQCAVELKAEGNLEDAKNLYGHYKAGLIATIRGCAVQYFRANSINQTDEELAALMEACADYVREKYSGFSIAEVKQAFTEAIDDPDINAYGQLSVQMVAAIMRKYSKARGYFLIALGKAQAQLAEAELAAAKNAAAAEIMYKEFCALQIENKKYKSWHACPAFVRGALLEHKKIELAELMHPNINFGDMLADASSQSYYDFLQGARWQEGAGTAAICIKFIKSFAEFHKLAPMPSGNSEEKIRGVYPFIRTTYTNKEVTKRFLSYHKNMVDKQVYFACIAPYTGAPAVDTEVAQSLLDAAEAAAMQNKNEGAE